MAFKEFRHTGERRFRLASCDPGYTAGFKSKDQAEKRLRKGVARLRALQEMLYAQDSWSVLLIFQAMDAAGKDSTIEHVMSGVNPQGCQVFSFKAPSSEELDHDFLWRTTRCLPERGRIGVFNRSYYEEVLVVRVHPEILSRQRLPAAVLGKRLWQERFEDIRGLERHLARNGTKVLKFFLHVSRKEQKERFLARLEEPEKHWKFSLADAKERAHWGEYMAAYEDMIRNTATPWAPWYVIPADHKWFMRMAVADVVVGELERMKLHYPTIGGDQRKQLQEAGRLLTAGR